jgi:hypothetical protein
MNYYEGTRYGKRGYEVTVVTAHLLSFIFCLLVASSIFLSISKGITLASLIWSELFDPTLS